MGKASFFNRLRVAYLLAYAMGLTLLALGGLLQPLTVRAAPTPQSQGFVYRATFKLPITPISAEYYNRLISTAEKDGAAAIVVELDTPGGLVDSMQVMVQRTLSSRVPVIVYVAPQGAMATSAGVFIVYASHVAAMAPNTTIGSSEVVSIGSDGGEGEGTPESGEASAMRRKATNLLVSQIRNLAEQHGRNADFAEKAVRESANVTSQAALDQKVVDILAPSLDDLLAQADGRKVKLNGQEATLATKGASVRELTLTFAEEVLLLLTNPSIAFVLISLGTLGITWEFINPGSVFPGVVGALCLLTGFLGLGTLPINAAGLVFMVLAFVLFIADIFMPTHGILTAGGIAALIIGGLLLVNTAEAPGVPGVSPQVVFGTASALGAVFFFAVYKVFQARSAQPTTGREGLVGQIAEARTDLSPSGMVFVEGELWNAISSNGPIPSGQLVRVVASEGLRLKVKPAEAEGEGVDTVKL